MIEEQSNLINERMGYQPDPDLLSDLPLSLIHIILARVPIRDAVRTSILSRQWRYTWATLPHLVLDKKCTNSEGKSRSQFENCMKKIITHVLSRHKGPIHKFKMSVFFEKSSPNIGKWILRLSRNDIKELILHMGSPDFHLSPRLHSSIYSCEKLTDLQLNNCELDPPSSTFKGFLFLKCLFLQDVCLSPDGIETLIANSPLLEDFTLFDSCSELRINAPKLKSLTLSGEYKEICLYAPLLAEMSILVLDNSTRHSQQKSSCNYANFFGSLTNLEMLSGELYFTKTNYDLTEGDDPSDSEAPNVSFRDFGCAPDFTFAKLRLINMKFVSGSPPEVELITFLLESSPVLEAMGVVYIDTLGTEEVQNLKDELLGCNWASPKCGRFLYSSF